METTKKTNRSVQEELWACKVQKVWSAHLPFNKQKENPNFHFSQTKGIPTEACSLSLCPTRPEAITDDSSHHW